MFTTFYRACIELTNQRLFSSLLKSFSKSRLSKPFVGSFSKTFSLNQAEMERPIAEYRHLHDLFIRTLKTGSRPIDESSGSIVSPVDGVIAQAGMLENETTFIVKGQSYTIDEMLGSTESAKRYRNGTYFILYLSPSHYHRIHSPLSGEITKQWTLGNRSYPVNNAGLRYGKRPLSRNYRVISELIHGMKHMAIVKVGAMNVNTIELTHSSERVNKGDEIGYFSFGSTVVLLVEEGLVSPNTMMDAGEVRVGERIAMLADETSRRS